MCLFGALALSQSIPSFMCLQYKSYENIVGKGEISRNEQFLLFPQCFLLVWRTYFYYIKFKIVICKLSHFERV